LETTANDGETYVNVNVPVPVNVHDLNA